MSASQQTVGGEVSPTRNERLDRLPFNKAHRKLLVASGIGWAFDAMDVGLVSFVVAAIAADPHFNLTPTEKSWVLSIGFVGMAIGAALGGFVADRVGRKTVFSATLVIFGLANGGMALSWSLAALLIARLVIGLGLGAELPVASTLVSEFSPTKQRGRMTVLLESFWAIGWIIAACIGYFVIPNTGDWGWRWALLIGALPLLYAIVTRIHIPESVRFLESKGREDEAEQAVRYFEQAGGVEPVASPKGEPLPKIKTRELFGKKYLGKVPNDASGRVSLWNDIVKHHTELQDIRAIENFSGENVTVEKGDTKKSVVVTDYVTPVNAMEQLYMTVYVQ